MMLGPDTARRLVEEALRLSPADETEVAITAGAESLTRFANSAIHQNVHEENADVRVRAVVGQRVGVATTNSLGSPALGEVVERATQVARLQPPRPDFPGLPRPRPIVPVDAWSEATATCTPERRALLVRAVCARALAHGLEAAGALSTGYVERAIGNSHGLFAYEARTTYSLKTVIMGEDASGYASRSGVDLDAADLEAAGTEAVERALRARHPTPIDPGEYTVLLEPYAVESLIAYLAWIAFGARSLEEGHSFLVGRMGQRVVGENITIVDDGRDPRTLPVAFDAEGVPKQRVVIIDRGVARAVVHDTETAARAGTESTGHALPAPNPAGPLPLNLILEPGSASHPQMLRAIDRGIWVTRFHYVNVLHARQTVLTGMTRDGTFLVERGEVTRPLKNLRFTQSVAEALGRVRLVGDTPHLSADEFGGNVVPALLVDGFRFTGVTEF